MVPAAEMPGEVPDSPDGYENLVRIDQGGFAVVYRARDTRFDRTVALKILRSENLDERLLRRFDAECLATGRLSSHPNIVTVYHAGTTRGHRPWLAMEYCSGGSLAHRVARQGPLPVAEVISIGVGLCGALSAAHEAGILHRDVKPSNVLLTSYGEPALADFGIASVRIGRQTTSETADETGAHTVVHAAPEILAGLAGTSAADIYSLGSTLYTLLAGQPPFARPARAGLAPLVAAILRGDLPDLIRPGVPPELEELLRRSMAAQPDDRPASAAELGSGLAGLGRRLAADEAGQLSPGARRGATARVRSRRLLVTLGGVWGVLLAVFTASGFSFHGSEPEAVPPKAAARAAVGAAPENRYAPKGLVVAPGRNRGELVVTWRMPIRPDVVATVIYQGLHDARAIVSYDDSPQAVPQTTLQGLPAGQQVCVIAADVVSVDDRVSDVVSRPVCAAAR